MTQRSHSASKKLGKKKGALPKGQGKTGKTEFTHESPATSATNSPRKVDDICPPNFSVPNHSYGVHVKRKQFIVEVQLHHIPEKLIDVEVVKDRVTVSTLRYTKKYKLDVVIPTDVEPDIHTASSILDHSTLRVIVPLTILADHYSERVNAIRQDREKARMLRFDQTQEGNLKMRVKKIQTKSPPTSGHRGATVESSSKQNKKRSREETDALSGIKKKKEQRTTASLEESYATEKDVALRLMKDVAEQTQLKLAEKQERLEKLQKLRSERILTRRECIKERDEKKTVAYQKMLMEKKSHLQRMIEQQGLVEPVVVQHVAPAKSHSAPHNNENKKGKRVSWAMA